MDPVIDALNTFFWGYVLIYGLLAVGVFFTLRLGFIQFRHFGEIIGTNTKQARRLFGDGSFADSGHPDQGLRKYERACAHAAAARRIVNDAVEHDIGDQVAGDDARTGPNAKI